MKHRRTLAVAFTALAAVGLAACHSASSSAAAPASSAPATQAAAKAPATHAPTVTAAEACNALLDWENGSASGNVADSASLRQTFQNTSEPLSSDFATWTSDIRSDPSLDNVDADRVGSDCAAYGITIFPSDSD